MRHSLAERPSASRVSVTANAIPMVQTISAPTGPRTSRPIARPAAPSRRPTAPPSPAVVGQASEGARTVASAAASMGTAASNAAKPRGDAAQSAPRGNAPCPGKHRQSRQCACHAEPLQQQVRQHGAGWTRQVDGVTGRRRVQRRIARVVAGQRHQQSETEQPERQPAQFRRAAVHQRLDVGGDETAFPGGPGSGHAALDPFVCSSRANGTVCRKCLTYGTPSLACRWLPAASLSRSWSIACQPKCAWSAPARWAARWPAGWRPRAFATVVVDRAALPPMEQPAFDGRAYAIAAGSRRLPGGRGAVGQAARTRLSDPRHPRERWPRRPARLAPVPAFRPSRGCLRPRLRSAGWWKRAVCAWR